MTIQTYPKFLETKSSSDYDSKSWTVPVWPDGYIISLFGHLQNRKFAQWHKNYQSRYKSLPITKLKQYVKCPKDCQNFAKVAKSLTLNGRSTANQENDYTHFAILSIVKKDSLRTLSLSLSLSLSHGHPLIKSLTL